MQIFGVDVYRGTGNINWPKAMKNGVRFAILKAGGSDDGFYKDAKFETFYADAKAAGLPVGAYYYVGEKCTSKADGVADAKRFLEYIKGKQFEYPVYIDFEDPDNSNIPGNTEACIGFCDTMEKAGYYCGIYASALSGFRDKLDITKLKKYDKWVADYRDRTEPGYVKDYGIWQYTSTKRIGGIGNIMRNVDCNWCYKDYPTIIKAAGLNGFKRPEGMLDTKPVTSTTEPTTSTKPATTKPSTSTSSNTSKDKYTAGQVVNLKDCPLYVSATSRYRTNTVTGVYYLWSKTVTNGRIRITTTKANVGKPRQVTGWIAVSSIKKATSSTTTTTAPATKTRSKGEAVKLAKAPIYISSVEKTPSGTLTGTYYLYDGENVHGRYRVTTKKANCGKSPAAKYVTGWVKL